MSPVCNNATPFGKLGKILLNKKMVLKNFYKNFFKIFNINTLEANLD